MSENSELAKNIIENAYHLGSEDCPECSSIEDDQYTCLTCGCFGGQGTINVRMLIELLVLDIELLEKEKKGSGLYTKASMS